MVKQMLISPLKGLVTKASPHNIPPDACAALVNFVVNETGQLVKRPGTKLLVSSGSDNYFVKQLATVHVLVGVTNGEVFLYDKEGTTLTSFDAIYSSNVDLVFNNVDDADFYGVVIFGENCNVVQLNFAEYTYSHIAGSRTVYVENWDADYVIATVDGVSVAATITGVGTLTVDYPGTAKLTLIHVTYSVWLPAQYFFGNELFGAITKSTTSKVALVPEDLLTDLTVVDASLINIYLDNNTLYNVTSTPIYSNDATFSDGQEYDNVTEIRFSPNYITFGQQYRDLQFDLSILDVDIVNDSFVIQGHKLEDNMFVQFKNEAPSPFALDTNYVVTARTANTFKLSALGGGIVSITDTYNTTRPTFTFNTYQIEEDGTLQLPSGTFDGKRKYKVVSAVLLPAELENNTNYYITAASGVITFYAENDTNNKIVVNRLRTLSFEVSAVNFATDEITIPGHGYFSGQPVALTVSYVSPLAINTVYYVLVKDVDTIELYTDKPLINLIDLVSTGASPTLVSFITDAWGDIYLYPEYEDGFIQTTSYNALLSRRRQIKFDSSSVSVRVDGITWDRTASKGSPNTYYVTNSAGNVIPLVNPVSGNDYIAFEATALIGVSTSSFVEFIDTSKGGNMNTSFTISTSYNDRYINGSNLPKYGYHDFFSKTEFPTVAVSSNNRLFLGRNLLVVSSNTLDSFINNRYYNNFIVDDRLTGTDIEPYYFIISGSGVVVDFVEFQNNLFIFTTQSIYRLNPVGALSYVVQNVANQGVSSRNAVTKLQSFIAYANEYGVYLLNSEVQDLYYAMELSSAIGENYKNHDCVALVFDPSRDSLYSFGVTESYCYHVVAKAWSEFRYPVELSNAFFIDEVYLVSTDNLLKFSDVPLDLHNEGIELTLNSYDAYDEGVLVLERLALPTEEVDGVHYLPSEITPFSPTVVIDYTNRVSSVATTFYVNCALYESYYGYEIQSLLVSGSVTQENLADIGVNRFVEASFSPYPGDESQASFGLLFGGNPEPSLLVNSFSSSEYSPYSSFIVFREPIQGVANSYQFLLYSGEHFRTKFNGFDLYAQPGVSHYYSGGR